MTLNNMVIIINMTDSAKLRHVHHGGEAQLKMTLPIFPSDELSMAE